MSHLHLRCFRCWKLTGIQSAPQAFVGGITRERGKSEGKKVQQWNDCCAYCCMPSRNIRLNSTIFLPEPTGFLLCIAMLQGLSFVWVEREHTEVVNIDKTWQSLGMREIQNPHISTLCTPQNDGPTLQRESYRLIEEVLQIYTPDVSELLKDLAICLRVKSLCRLSCKTWGVPTCSYCFMDHPSHWNPKH